jgi:D-arabinose 1-dehydrogenase-like Zn-dependent alcohol dehydrogenase
VYPAKPEDFEFCRDFVPIVERLVAEGKVKPHRLEVRGGLGDINAGLKELKAGKVSGKKLVYRIGQE